MVDRKHWPRYFIINILLEIERLSKGFEELATVAFEKLFFADNKGIKSFNFRSRIQKLSRKTRQKNEKGEKVKKIQLQMTRQFTAIETVHKYTLVSAEILVEVID